MKQVAPMLRRPRGTDGAGAMENARGAFAELGRNE